MPQWPIRVKLIVGLSLVVGMMLTLLGGSIVGLGANHRNNRTLTNQLVEIGASKRLMERVVRLPVPRLDRPAEVQELERGVRGCREALATYFTKLKQNASQGDRADDGRDELVLAFVMDHDLTMILNELHPGRAERPLFPGTQHFLDRHPKVLGQPGWAPGTEPSLAARIQRLNGKVMELPNKLYQDVYEVLQDSRRQYRISQIIVWTSAVAGLAMLVGLARLLRRWVLEPVRLLHAGVLRVARGRFDGTIDLHTGDEMQALAEAFNDMTARLGATYADLERQVQDRSRQLVRSERLAGVGFLAAGVAHEINNPLASIAFGSEALEGRLGPILKGRPPAEAQVVQTYLRMIQEEAFRCKRITEKLLDYSRCGEIRREPTDLAELVRGVAEMIRHMGKYKNKHIIFNPREAVVAHADAQEIKQVVLNLVVNALDCMDEGGTLRIDLRRQGDAAEMVFADDGCGMAPEVLENIFEPFFTRRQVGKGTGLGLSITHRIISQHGGEIAATSPGEGLGSTFTVRLPSQPPGPAAPVAEPRPAPSRTRPREGPARRLREAEAQPSGTGSA